MITTNTEMLGQGGRPLNVSSPLNRMYIRHAASKMVRIDNPTVVKFGHLKDRMGIT